ncbi:MAG: MacB family efflux pump subunit [Deltaproteobacteria bacterium]|jgi:macrolide transport system ATP-binding/permease protein|nr:MacB family efflux pump subunit [Deltaproteobacteria bacterium]
MNIIELTNVTKVFGTPPNEFHALKNINLSIQKGDFVAIVGQSGSGKTTLMNIMGCLDPPTTGSYKIDSLETLGLSADDLAWVRGHKVGFVFQRYNLLASLTARENVSLPAVYTGSNQTARSQRSTEILTRLGLEEKLTSRPNELSGGQQQRVSIARALMNGGDIILADEPTGALDSQSGQMVLEILTQLHEEGHTVILVTHDMGIAASAHRIIEIKDGEIVSDSRRIPLKESPTELPQDHWNQLNPFSFYRDQFIEAFKMAVEAIFSHKLRSLLTMLGIIIGIASVVAVLALGRGSQERVLENINSMGTNTINIYPGTGFGDRFRNRYRTLTVSDSDLLDNQSYLDSSTPITSSSGILVYGNQSLSATLTGAGAKYFDVRGLAIDLGRPFTEADVRDVASVVVIDPNTRDKLFPDGENPVGKIIIFLRQPLQVIGVTQPQTILFGPTDQLNLWAPYTTVMSKITGEKYINSIMVKVSDVVSSQIAEKNLTSLLTVKHGGTKDFFTQNTDTIKQTVENTTRTMTLLISSIALISLIVGGIGVMNIMLVSVTERTREIGTRMAIGAKPFNIMEQFLIEAILLCMMGAIAGIILSGIIGFTFNAISTDFRMSFTLSSIVLALVCSTMVGIAFGFMPARNASKLNPIVALSYE